MLNTGPAPCELGGPIDPVCVSFSTVPSQRDSNTFNERPEGLLGSRMPDDAEDKTSSHDEETLDVFRRLLTTVESVYE